MSRPLIYLSGPMSGIADHNRPAFRSAHARLLAAGHRVWSPAELPPRAVPDWPTAMRACLRGLARADALALLPGWEQSRGAALEVHIARELGIPAQPLSHYLAPETPT